MMKAFPILLFTGLILAGTNCKKEEVTIDPVPHTPATYRLKVVDLYTDAPIEGATCTFLGIGSDYYERLGADTSDANGMLLKDDQFYTRFKCDIKKPGYVSKLNYHLEAALSKVNDYKILMRPFDAVVKLEVENVQPYPDTLLFNLLNGGAIADAGNFAFLPFDDPLILQPAEKFTANIPVLGDDLISVFWTWQKKYLSIPLKNLVTVPVGDTLTYKITN